jgi:hypothetical protein
MMILSGDFNFQEKNTFCINTILLFLRSLKIIIGRMHKKTIQVDVI